MTVINAILEKLTKENEKKRHISNCRKKKLPG